MNAYTNANVTGQYHASCRKAIANQGGNRKMSMQNPDSQGVRVTISDFMRNQWFPICIQDGSRKITTVDFYRSITRIIYEYFGEWDITAISTTDIRKFFSYLRTDYRSNQGTPLGDVMVRHCYCVLVQVFQFAVEEELIQKSPMDKVHCPKIQKKKVNALSETDAARFLAVVPTAPQDFRCMLYLLVTTGIRRGELLALQWGDIDFTNLTIHIQRSVSMSETEGLVVGTPKTQASIRDIPLMPFVCDELLSYKQATKNTSKEMFAFPANASGTMPKNPGALTHRVKRFMKSNGLPDMSPHDLRHTCATLLVSSGADIKSVQEILGHTDASTTLNFYVSTNMDRLRAATDKLGVFLTE